ncbi:hypothetical protein [Fusibacter ferrireducens]|uniref:DUF5673 domain-containing protein n=1 Tax=Fusibacter ferrireducens TaxID=2785058 RepID=A0ABR9ZY77_9FIRM|nr:hypothetical protein [Fusibacter ferrireducens]MBF4694830.1 hypothetical protein [Fusibacter ferrireducens]
MGYFYENVQWLYMGLIFYALADLIVETIRLRRCGHLIEAFQIKQEGAWGIVIVNAIVVLLNISLVIKTEMNASLFSLTLIMFSILLISSVRTALRNLKIYEDYLVLPLCICRWEQVISYKWEHIESDRFTPLSIYISGRPKFLYRQGKKKRIKIEEQYISRINTLLREKVSQ